MRLPASLPSGPSPVSLGGAESVWACGLALPSPMWAGALSRGGSPSVGAPALLDGDRARLPAGGAAGVWAAAAAPGGGDRIAAERRPPSLARPVWLVVAVALVVVEVVAGAVLWLAASADSAWVWLRAAALTRAASAS